MAAGLLKSAKMSEVQNPFAKPVTKAGTGAGNPKAAWIAAGVMAVVAAVMGGLWAIALAHGHEADAMRAALDEAKAKISNDVAAIQHANDQSSNLMAQIADLQKQKADVGDAAKRLEDEMRSDLESKDVTISNLKGKLTVTILDRVMFDSGAAALKPDGEAVLRKVADLLAKHPNLQIQVIGHTDNVPIHTVFPSNWELSAARALAAVHFLTEKAGLAPQRVGAVGYGEYRPIADNSTAEGRARNRRIAITILPDELAGADAAPAAVTDANPVVPNSSEVSTNAGEAAQ